MAMRASRIQAVDHVNLESPFGLDEDLRWFYGEVAELEEKPWEAPHGPGICFGSEQIELRIRFSTEALIEAVDCRVILAVASIEDATAMLSERHVECYCVSGLSWSNRRIQVLDPAGNRIGLKQIDRDLTL